MTEDAATETRPKKYYCVGRRHRRKGGYTCYDPAVFAVHADLTKPGPTSCAQHVAQLVKTETAKHQQRHVTVIVLHTPAHGVSQPATGESGQDGGS